MIWQIDTVALTVGQWPIHWYGIFFAFGLLATFLYTEAAFRRQGWDREFLIFIPFGFLGPIIGGRVAHFVFYDGQLLASSPTALLSPLAHPGLASHGAILGLLLAGLAYSALAKIDYWWLVDRICTGFLLIGGIVRIGNFFRSELVGVPTTMPWGIVFSSVDAQQRHPVQLYEAVCYLALFLLLLSRETKVRDTARGVVAGAVICGVAVFRIGIEYFKEGEEFPIFGALFNVSQWLSVPFLLLGTLLLIWRRALMKTTQGAV